MGATQVFTLVSLPANFHAFDSQSKENLGLFRFGIVDLAFFLKYEVCLEKSLAIVNITRMVYTTLL